MKKSIDTSKISIGVVGLGLMGSSITTCLLIAGHPVVAVAPLADDLKQCRKSYKDASPEIEGRRVLSITSPKYYLRQLTITEDYNLLKDCSLVIECTIRKPGYQKISV